MYKYSGWIARLVEAIDSGAQPAKDYVSKRKRENLLCKKSGSCHPRVAYRSYPILSLQILILILYLVYASHETRFLKHPVLYASIPERIGRESERVRQKTMSHSIF